MFTVLLRYFSILSKHFGGRNKKTWKQLMSNWGEKHEDLKTAYVQADVVTSQTEYTYLVAIFWVCVVDLWENKTIQRKRTRGQGGIREKDYEKLTEKWKKWNVHWYICNTDSTKEIFIKAYYISACRRISLLIKKSRMDSNDARFQSSLF